MIGSNLCEHLLGLGHEVLCVDNLSTGQRENVRTFESHPRFRFVEHDIVQELPPFPRLDRVYHLASPASPAGYVRAQIETLRVNSEGTRRLLELASLHGARLLYSSTSEAYGDPLVHPQTEEYRGNVSCTGPRSMYDEAKRYGEALTMAFVRTRGLDARIVRIFNTYGPRSHPNDGRLVVNLIVQALRRQPMTIYGDGGQTRSLCYVADLVEGLTLAMESPRAGGEVINLGNPDEHTVLDVARIVRELAGFDSRFTFGPPAVGDDPRLRRPDIGKALSLLGWEPRVGLRQGLLLTIDFMRQVLDGPRRAMPRRAPPARARLRVS